MCFSYHKLVTSTSSFLCVLKMTISDEKNNGKGDNRNLYLRIKQKFNSELIRRQSNGLTYIQALTGLSQDILNGNFNGICSPPPPGISLAEMPSMIALNQALNESKDKGIRARISTAASISHSLSGNSFNFGNAVRNLEPEFSAQSPPNQAIVTAENHTSLTTLSSNRMQILNNLSCSRSRNIDPLERMENLRKIAKEWKRVAASWRNTNERERTPAPREIENDPKRTSALGGTVKGPERTSSLSGIVKDLEKAQPQKKIVNDQKKAPFFIGIDNNQETSPIRTGIDNDLKRAQSLNRIFSEREITPPPRRILHDRVRAPVLRRILNKRERTPSPKKTGNDPENTPPFKRNANDPERALFPRRTDNAAKRATQNLLIQFDPNIPLYQYDPNTFNPSNLTLDQALTVMSSFNTENDREYELIRTSLLAFSIKIYGLESCAKENLVPKILLFIDRYFDIQPEIELCVRLVRDHEARNVVGVLFDRCVVVNHILTSSNILTNTRYWVSNNDLIDWIICNYEHR